MKDIKTFLGMIHQVIYILDSKQRVKCFFVFILTLIGALFETLGISAIMPFIQAIMTPEKLRANPIVKPFISIFSIQNDYQLVLLMGIGIIVVYIVKNAYLLLLTYAQSRFRTQFLKDVSIKLFRYYVRKPYTYFLNTNSSEVVQGINGDSHSVYDVLDTMFKLASELLASILIAIFIITIEPFIAFGVLSLAILTFLGVTFSFKKRMSRLGSEIRKASEKQYLNIYQTLNGIKEIKVLQRSESFINRFQDTAEITRRVTLEQAFMNGIPERLIEALCVSGLILTVCIRFGAGLDANVFIPQLATFSLAAFRILPSISRITGYASTLVFYRSHLEMAYNNFLNGQYDKGIDNNEDQTMAQSTKDDTLASFDSVSLIDISWKYNQQQDFVIKNLNMKITRGESIAFIGTSGAGKTTLADILLGLLPPACGTIKVDGQDVFENPIMWSKMVGYVPQSVFLVDDTIRENITFGIQDEQIDETRVWNALEQAQLKEFVEQLPDQLDTIVGERGVKFSGGQRQRIAIARALYNNPPILVLDEATSALDNETESAVMEAVEVLQGYKTLIIVAHRLSTIRNCDKIYEIRNGRAILRDKKEVFQ